jgi:hypothetical protein
MAIRVLLPCCLCLGIVAVACANEPPTAVGDEEPGKMHAVLSVERSDSALSDGPGSASAVARFVSLPALADVNRVLTAAGVTLELPPVDTCLASGSQVELEPPPAQGGVEFVEAGDVTIATADTVTPLVPHAFPTVGGFASGVLYTTKDRTSSALPAAQPYVISASGSGSVPALRAVVDAPRSPANVLVGGVPLGEASELHTGSVTQLSWAAGDASDLVYAELFAYDGSTSVLCTFRDDAGSGTIAADAFTGIGSGRIALHRVHSQHLDNVTGPSTDVRFDFQVGSAIDFSR